MISIIIMIMIMSYDFSIQYKFKTMIEHFSTNRITISVFKIIICFYFTNLLKIHLYLKTVQRNICLAKQTR